MEREAECWKEKVMCTLLSGIELRKQKMMKAYPLLLGGFFPLGGLPPRYQINHTRRLILNYKFTALAWLVARQLFLN